MTRVFKPYASEGPGAEPSDRSLLGQLLDGQTEAARIVQSVFRRFFQAAQRGGYHVPVGAELWGMLLVIARNRIRSAETYHRAAKRDIRLSLSHNDDLAQDHDPLFQVVMKEALDRMPAMHRRAVEYRLAGYEVVDIAEEFGRSRRTIERLLQEARKELLVLLEEKG